MKPAQNMRHVRLIPRSVAINLWNYHSHLNRGPTIIIEAHLLRMQRPGTWSRTAIVHLDKHFLGCGTSFWHPLLTLHHSRHSQRGHNRLYPGMSSAMATLPVRIPVFNTHHILHILRRNPMDRIMYNMTGGLIYQFWTHSQWLDNSPKDRRLTLMQVTMWTAEK